MTEQLVTLPWQHYLAVVLWLLGAGLVGAGVRAGASYRGRQQSAPAWAMAYLVVFRRVVPGLAIVGAGLGLFWQEPGLVAGSLCIAVGELLESTFYIEVMRWGRRHGVGWLVSQ
jgi:hypothetical protein